MRAKSLHKIVLLLLLLINVSFFASAQISSHFNSSAISGCAPLSVSFTDQSTGSPVSWLWNDGNGNTFNIQNPGTIYINPGVYTVSLTVTNASGNTSTTTKTITVNSKPTVNFSGNPLSGCSPLPVAFTNTSTAGSGSITNYFWDFGDGNTLTVANPSHTYVSSGQSNVTLQVTNSAGCVSLLTKPNYVNVSSAVNAMYINSLPVGCGAPQTITFTNQSTGGAGVLSYLWNFGDGNTSTAQSPTHTYTTTGTFNVLLTVTNSSGCSASYTNPSPIIIGAVNASFTPPLISCVNQSLAFTNTSTPTPVSALWNYGDASSSTGINGVKTYTLPGVYTVTLTSNFGGCTASTSQTITVLPKPLASFTTSALLACSVPHTVNFVNTSVGGASYEWLFGDGGTSTSASPSHTYTAFGTYGITLIATNINGCTDTLRSVDSVRIQPIDASINYLPSQGCAPLFVNFSPSVSTLVPITGYQWSFGDGATSTAANPSHTYAAGTYDIQLIVTTANGCTDTVFIPSAVIASVKPTANFTANPLISCAINPITFTDLSTGITPGTSWNWSFGDGGTATTQNPNYSYVDTGNFNVQLIVSNNGCSDTLTITDFIHINPPIAAFNLINDCSANKFTKSFTDASVGADSYLWDFGDGNTSTLASPTHTYAAVGSYNVTLTVHNNLTGCDHQKASVVVVSNETANFTASVLQMCKNNTSTFNATSINTPSGITAYYWNFGDGGLDTGNNVTHTFVNSGSYSVQLIVADLNGCRDTTLLPNYINVYGPDINFQSNIPGTCPNGSILFTDISTTDGIHPLTEWTWNYGDASPTQTLNVNTTTHPYVLSGSYDVTLTIKDSYGCTQTLTKPSMVIISLPTSDFTSIPESTCTGQPVAFNNAATGPGLTYLWNFGDGNTSTSPNPTHQYALDGNYTVTLTVTDIYGCTATEIKNQFIQVNTPVASFTVNDSVGVCSQLNVQFTNTTSNIVSQLWDFGDGGTSTGLNPSHFYVTPGVYTATLTTTSIGGCISTKTKIINITGPTGTFTYNPISGCNSVTVNFIANTQNRVSFIWDFNDGTLLATTDSLPSHTYTTVGSYVPKMILVGSAAGCTIPIVGIDTIKVFGVTGTFSPDITSICSSGDVTFTSNATSNDIITGYAWNFGDGGVSTNQNPIHLYNLTGVYNPTLTVTTQSGCTVAINSLVPIKVFENPNVTITPPSLICLPKVISLQGNILNLDTSALTWQWNLSTGATHNGQNFSNISLTTAGTYNAQLTVTNSSGCIGNTNITFDAHDKPNVNAGNDITICKGTGQPLNATGAATYIWSPAAGLNTTIGASVIATPDSVKNYIVVGTSSIGCTNNDTINVAVKYPFKITHSLGDTLCVGEFAKLTASGAYSYNWYQNNFSPAQNLNSTTSPIVNANPNSTTTYAVIGTDDKNCFKDTAFYYVKVYPIPTISAGIDKTINVGQSTTLTPTASADVTNITWSPSTWVVGSNYPSITVKPNQNQDYIVTAKNPGGCTSNDVVSVFVLCDGSNFFIPNTFSPNGDGMNDKFFPRGTGLFTIKQMRIYNRWGEEVFAKYNYKANDINAGWDGTKNGVAVASDAYVYMIEIQCDNNATMLYKGNVTLIR